ncbi:MAG: hypothetical protein QGG40_04645 [Myxococcota bacterium]|nr:hypothetical protein [Myxococcota bacterium]
MAHFRLHGLMCLGVMLGTGCKSDQGIAQLKYDDIAVTTGDFDYVEETLTRLDVGYTRYEGYITQPAYDPEFDADVIGLEAENLFAEIDGEDPDLYSYDALFVNSGTRGLGAFAYNGTEEDDQIVADEAALDVLRTFVDRGGGLVVSDWGYDLVEAAWPDLIDFLNDDETLDAAQVGTSESVTATVTDPTLASRLDDQSEVQLTFDYTYWSIIDTVSDDVEVLLEGDTEYRVSDSSGYGDLESVPLLVKMKVGGGVVLYSAFHWHAQTSALVDEVLLYSLEGLSRGSGTDEEEGE